MIKAKNISKGFYQNKNFIPVLRNMSFEVEPGEVLAILGPSGSGKSTLLSILALLDAPDEGELSLADHRISDMKENERTIFRGKNIGIVFQQYHLVHYLTALENVTLPLAINGSGETDDIQSQALSLLTQVGLKDRESHRPNQLSGGESQRVALARALIHKPKLLLADEPSGNLDQNTSSTVMDLFFHMIKSTKTTSILVTHDQALAERCDRKLFLKDGKLCSQS